MPRRFLQGVRQKPGRSCRGSLGKLRGNLDPAHPTFGLSGRCRMLHESPEAFDTPCLPVTLRPLVSSLGRQREIQREAEFGDMKHVSCIQMALSLDLSQQSLPFLLLATVVASTLIYIESTSQEP
eukprot:scaffold5297_cov153-Pinguiococcus_pyrenoidosus.AAC.1